MKKYFVFAAAALVALASCSKVEIEPSAQNGPEIGFQVAKYMASTKAEAEKANSAFSTAETFGTFAVYTDGAFASAQTKTAFMDNVEIIYTTSGTAKVWKANGETYYWPKTGKLSFISYAPYAASATGSFGAVPTFTASTKTFAVEDYTVLPTVAAQDAAKETDGLNSGKYDANDLMYSTFVSDQTHNTSPATYGYSSVSEGVPTLFHHMLSKINVKVKVGTVPAESKYQYKVVVKKIALKNIANKGSYSNTAVDGTTGTWTASDKVAAVDLYTSTKSYTDADAVVLEQNAASATSHVADYYVLPQYFKSATDETTDPDGYTGNDGATLVVEYDLYTLTKGDTPSLVSKESITETTTDASGNNAGIYSVLALNTMTVSGVTKPQWAENTIVTYTVTINPGSEILFDPAVAKWNEATAAGTIDL